MVNDKATVVRIRPVSWKVSVVGADCTKQVCRSLCEAGFECTAPTREPDLHDESIFAFVATPKAATSLTAPELQAILTRDGDSEVVFEDF